MSEQNEFFMEAKPQVSVFVAEDGNLRINVTQIDERGDKVEFNSISLPLDCVQQVADAMLRIAKG